MTKKRTTDMVGIDPRPAYKVPLTPREIDLFLRENRVWLAILLHFTRQMAQDLDRATTMSRDDKASMVDRVAAMQEVLLYPIASLLPDSKVDSSKTNVRIMTEELERLYRARVSEYIYSEKVE